MSPTGALIQSYLLRPIAQSQKPCRQTLGCWLVGILLFRFVFLNALCVLARWFLNVIFQAIFSKQLGKAGLG